jgi:transposase-like protein
LKQVFLLGVSTRQAGCALATLVEETVSASTVSTVAKVLDVAVCRWHRRPLADHYRYLILDGVSVRIRLVGPGATTRGPLRLWHHRRRKA